MSKSKRIYWSKGSGYNTLSLVSDDGRNAVYSEYELDGSFAGTLKFYNNYSKGRYERNDGKDFDFERVK